MVNQKKQLPLKQNSFEQALKDLIASIYVQKNMLNYLAHIERKKLTQLKKNSTSCLDFERMSQSVGDTLEKIALYQTLVDTKLKSAYRLSPRQINSYSCHYNSCTCSMKNHHNYWGRY